jgi:putative protease
MDVRGLSPEVYLPFKELTAMKKRLLFVLNGNKDPLAPVSLPSLAKHRTETLRPAAARHLQQKEPLQHLHPGGRG